MGALVAAVNKKGEDAMSTVVVILRELAHRGNDSHGIATPSLVSKAATLEELEHKNCSSSVALGHNLSCILPRDQPQPVLGDSFTVVFEGRLFPAPNFPDLSEVQEIAGMLGSDPLRNAGSILEKMDGSYVFAIAESNRIVAGRDVFGATPLYYGEDGTVCVVASERKALWKIGLKEVQSFPPGQLAVIDAKGFFFHAIKELRMPPREKMDIETSSRALQLLLLESTRKQVSDINEVAVAFSGGLDSSVVAALAENVGLNVQLVSVGLEDQPEVMFTEQAAKALDLPIHLQTYTTSELEETFAKVLWLIEEPNPINACIAVPFYWLAETAAKLGQPVLLAGQGADELFGGYQRYLTEYEKSGAKAVEQKMFYDVKNAYRQNFQRDNQVCSYHSVELRMPFIDRDVVDFALRLPLRLKINSVEDRLRKRVLRRVANNLEIPSFMADKPKKAVQYTTGVTKAFQRIAKNKNLSLREYVEQTFSRIYHSRDSN
ncbi:asparagine synthetase B [Candidatus Bathyarchaeota archaeon]|nr:asparagine synthetase B [Candidatus Bathyarchaeota archaeon]